jgi:hypothetical protein
VPQQRVQAEMRLSVVVPPALMAAARQAVDDPRLTTSEVVRLALAHLGGVDIADFTPRPGRPRREPQRDQAELPGLAIDAGKGAAA